MAAASLVVRAESRAPAGVVLFASTQDEPRARRPTDIILAIVGLLLLLITSTVSTIGANLDVLLADLLDALPGLLDPFWTLVVWTPVAWAAVLVVAALARHRRPLARDVLAAAVIAALVAVAVAAIVSDGAWDVVTLFGDTDGPPVIPPGALTVSTAVLSTASPHLSRPFRHFGRWIIAGQLVASLMLGATTFTGGLAAIAVGTLAAAAVHLAVGSPGGRPTTSRIRLALQGLGVPAEDLAPASMHTQGVVLFEGRDVEGPLAVKVYGRDAWDGQLLANLWRAAWYRGAGPTVRLRRIELVEHEGFITLLADRAGVRVPHLVSAGSAGRGDALVVVRPDGLPLSLTAHEVQDAGLASLWADLRRLHGAGIVHRRLDLDGVVARPDGTLGLGDLSSASVVGTPADVLLDQAQALGVSIVLVGEERAVAAARSSLGDDALLKVLPYLQEPAMAPQIRDLLGDADLELDEIRGRLGVTLGVEEQPLIRLRRVTWGSVLNLALLAIAAYALIGVFGNLDLEAFFDELDDASWWWLTLALVLAQLPRVPSAVSTMGSIDRPLPLGPLTALQFAISYVNLAIPSTAARVAINVRFFERFGVGPATAVSAGIIDSVSGFVVQIAIFLLLFFASDLDLDLSTDIGDVSGLATVALIVILVVIALAAIVAAVPALRHRVLAVVSEARDALRVLRSPTKLVQLIGGNALAQVLFAIALAACVFGFGEEVPLGILLLINTVVSLFAGLLPVPGGIGVSEAGITLGLTAYGLPSETAFAAALAYRFASFYLPPVWGWFCYRWLVKQRYL